MSIASPRPLTDPTPSTSSPGPGPDFTRVGTLDELKAKTCVVVRGDEHPIAVFHDDGKVYAVDNRCPHMGFPLSRGTVAGGVITCHWHHARFDGSSGCTFDLFADDVPPADVVVRDGVVWVARRCRHGDPAEHGRRRQLEGMEQSIGLVIAKAVITRMRAGTDVREVVRDGVLFGARHRDGWSSGMTILAAMANLLPDLPEEERFLALYHGLSRVAADCAGRAPRRDRHPLEGSTASPDALRQWLRDWTRARHRDGAERTLLTAIAQGAAPADLAEMLLLAVTDRAYADGGHALDFINKACETLDLIGWEHAAQVLPSLVPQLVSGRGGEESSAWHHPIDLVALVNGAAGELPAWIEAGRGRTWSDEQALADAVLGDDPATIVEALAASLRAGATPVQVARAVALAAATRVARFGTANEFGDWIAALHTFTYANALHQALARLSANGRTPAAEVVRGVFHGAMVVYLDRFLNVPPAASPASATRASSTPSRPAPTSCWRGSCPTATPNSACRPRRGRSRGTCRSATRRARWSRRSPGGCCGRTRSSTRTRCSRRACARPARGVTARRRPARCCWRSRGTSRPTPPPSGHSCRRRRSR